MKALRSLGITDQCSLGVNSRAVPLYAVLLRAVIAGSDRVQCYRAVLSRRSLSCPTLTFAMHEIHGERVGQFRDMYYSKNLRYRNISKNCVFIEL